MDIQEMQLYYNVRIVDDSYYDPMSNNNKKRYKIITADGNKWENGLTWNKLRSVLKRDAKLLREFRRKC